MEQQIDNCKNWMNIIKQAGIVSSVTHWSEIVPISPECSQFVWLCYKIIYQRCVLYRNPLVFSLQTPIFEKINSSIKYKINGKNVRKKSFLIFIRCVLINKKNHLRLKLGFGKFIKSWLLVTGQNPIGLGTGG